MLLDMLQNLKKGISDATSAFERDYARRLILDARIILRAIDLVSRVRRGPP
jgi:hypothetical protein